MINFDDVTKENIKEYNPNWPEIFDHPHRILIIGGSGSGKTNSLFNLINQKTDIDKIYLYTKDPDEVKYKFLINKREDIGTKRWMIFIKTLKNIIQIRNVKYYSFLMI